MKTLIIKFGASGDVVRTTTLLHIFKDGIDWITSDLNSMLIKNLPNVNRIIPESQIEGTQFDHYDLVINLEDDRKTATLLNKFTFGDLYGAYVDKSGNLTYTENSNAWFDLGLISRYGLEKANRLKFKNTNSFQELVFNGLGYCFNGEPYYLPKAPVTDLYGDIAISPKAGKVWPSKNWAYYDELKKILVESGYKVNYLPQRMTLLEHMADVHNHRILISGDSLPMHFALGGGISCVTLFTCTSPTEIFDYNLQYKLISPKLEEYFYRRDFIEEATKSIKISEVLHIVTQILEERTANAI